jgi:hypothetical protein
MAGLLQEVQIFIYPLVEQRLAQDVEEYRRSDPESVELVEEAPDPPVIDVPFGPAQDVGRAEGAVHVAMARQFEKKRPRRIRGPEIIHRPGFYAIVHGL